MAVVHPAGYLAQPQLALNQAQLLLGQPVRAHCCAQIAAVVVEALKHLRAMGSNDLCGKSANRSRSAGTAETVLG